MYSDTETLKYYFWGLIILSILIIFFVFYFIRKSKKRKNNKIENSDTSDINKELIIIGNETYEPTSNFIIIVSCLFFLLFLILGIFSKNDFWENVIVCIFGTAFISWCLHLLYMFTPFYHRKSRKVKEINNYFKTRFHLLNNFDVNKHEKISEFNEEVKDLENEHLMFNIYMKAYKNNADAVILHKLNDQEINCALIKYK